MTEEKQLLEIETVFRKKCLYIQKEHNKKHPDQKILNKLHEELTTLQSQVNELKDELGIPH